MTPITFFDLLNILNHDDHVSLCTNAGGTFSSQVVQADEARNYRIPADCDVWFSVNPMHGPARINGGRGAVADVTRLAALYADLDIKQGGLKDPDTAWAVIDTLSEILHTRPSAITLSGNGLQPYWPLDDQVSGVPAMALLRRFGRLVRHIAGMHHGNVDSVYDLTRILRIPDSFNHKGEPKPVITLDDTGRPLTYQEIDEALTAYNVLETPEDRQEPGTVLKPTREWAWATRTCRYTTKMVESWSSATPNARHPWLLSQATRLAAAHRLNCITNTDHAAAIQKLRQRFLHLISTGSEKRPEGVGEVADAVAWGEQRIACKTETQAREELGSHTHDDDILELAAGSNARIANGHPVVEVHPDEIIDPDHDFWDRRPILTHLREFAYSRMCSPQAILGVTILRALHTIPPNVVLPPVIGGQGSLNMFVALVGSSGSGKGAAEHAAADALTGLGEIYSATTGSGEGIAHQYAHREKGEIVNDRDAVLFTVPEVDTITAIGSRQGSTLLSQLRSAFSGEKLGYSYADATRRIPINAHSYRLSMTIGVQPEKAGPLLHDADGGTPQRIAWLQATDPAITSCPPPQPEPMHITLPDWGKLKWNMGRRIIDIPDQVVSEIREAHAARARGEGTALDGHAMFAREKIAVAFAALDGRNYVNLEDWDLAGTVMRFSDLTRARIEGVLQGIEMRKRAAQTDLLVDRQVNAESRAWDIKVERIADLIAKWLVEMGGESAPSALRRRIKSTERDAFEYALQRLAEQGHVRVETEPNRRVKVVPK